MKTEAAIRHMFEKRAVNRLRHDALKHPAISANAIYAMSLPDMNDNILLRLSGILFPPSATRYGIKNMRQAPIQYTPAESPSINPSNTTLSI
jgi:hypothetical protein